MFDEHQLQSAANPTLGQRQRAYAVGLLMVCAGVLTLPLIGTHMPRSEVFILVVDTSLALISAFVTLLLLLQFSAARSSATLILACGFLLVTLTTLPQLLRAAEGAFVDLRLRLITDLILPVAAIAYARLRDRRLAWSAESPRVAPAVAAGFAMVAAIAALATWLTAASASAHAPSLGEGGDSWFAFATALVAGADVVAIAMVWRRLGSLLELWLVVALIAWLIETLMQGLASDGTSFVWHVAQLFGVLGTVGMMMALLADNAAPHASLTSSAARRRHRRGNRLQWKHRAAESLALDGMTDELAQPLCAITLNADAIARLLDQQPPDLQEIRAALVDIGDDARRASQTLQEAQLLLAEANEPAALIDIAQLVEECVSHLGSELARQRVTCEVETAGQLPGIRGFRRQLRQLLTHLIIHALEAMAGLQHRDRRLRLRTGLHDARAIAIWVEDSGTGLRSWRGLAVCRSIVDAHGGHISVSPGNGGGAACKVVLPAGS